MGRGVSSGGGQSSLGYLFGSNEEPKPTAAARAPPAAPPQSQPPEDLPPAGLCRKISEAEGSSTGVKRAENGKRVENGTTAEDSSLGRNFNNYHRADGQNTGNFITDRPTTKVHSAPGGGSSLGYLFGDK